MVFKVIKLKIPREYSEMEKRWVQIFCYILQSSAKRTGKREESKKPVQCRESQRREVIKEEGEMDCIKCHWHFRERKAENWPEDFVLGPLTRAVSLDKSQIGGSLRKSGRREIGAHQNKQLFLKCFASRGAANRVAAEDKEDQENWLR